jgi:hypothetical protein
MLYADEREKNMLCKTCAGTEYGELKQTFKHLSQIQIIPEKSPITYIACKDCYGQGARLVREGNCSHCGATLLHWQRCLVCLGTGKIAVISPRSRPKMSKQANSVK